MTIGQTDTFTVYICSDSISVQLGLQCNAVLTQTLIHTINWFVHHQSIHTYQQTHTHIHAYIHSLAVDVHCVCPSIQCLPVLLIEAFRILFDCSNIKIALHTHTNSVSDCHQTNTNIHAQRVNTVSWSISILIAE